MEQYIPKSALVAEIKKRKKEAESNCGGFYEEFLEILNTIKVKEVDLDFQRFAKEMKSVFSLPSPKTENTEEEPLNWEYAIAKHFYELGFKSQKE